MHYHEPSDLLLRCQSNVALDMMYLCVRARREEEQAVVPNTYLLVWANGLMLVRYKTTFWSSFDRIKL